MLTVHHLGISQSDRIVWLCEELGIPYQLRRYDRDPVTRLAPEEYRALHPFGTAPVITDGDFVLGESAAIVEYLIATHGGDALIRRASEPDFADYLFWFNFANSSMMPALMMSMVVGLLGGGDRAKALLARGDRAYAMIEDRLAKVPYLAGDAFSAADIMIHFPLTTGRVFAPRDISGYPNILTYLQRIAARPAYAAAMAKAEPDFAPMLT
ncbi:glutathione S-transferase family protein [Sphingomonas sp. IC4-52]|uniref:glutathione S-transferase family protein n=1 Tax=Sphingomonas sp. IC4-52 TaxID=2887202 RepID=UPI001D100161|nr:glutathione S-transferase [Sphingomonas sp. IC4-52]MCC2980134.1 glutathione S-transferase [Sphingomonas sp. IC4-52]